MLSDRREINSQIVWKFYSKVRGDPSQFLFHSDSVSALVGCHRLYQNTVPNILPQVQYLATSGIVVFWTE
jgi:hypothetical protein